MHFKVITCNVHGLAEAKKRRQIFHYVKDKEADIVFVHETHSVKQKPRIWQAEWGGKIVFAHGQSNSKGVCIMFNPSAGIKIIESKVIVEGRVLNVLVEINGKKVLLSNIYGPNEDDPTFFEKVFEELNMVDCEDVIVGGDMNQVLHERDHFLVKAFKGTKANKLINTYLEESGWADPRRISHPDSTQCTWVRRNPVQMSRLDYFLLLMFTLTKVCRCEIIPSILTDHSFVILEIEMEPDVRGPGYWKFNNSLLHDKEFLDEINKLIDETVCENIVDKVNLWEVLKIKIKNFAMDYSKSKRQGLGKRLHELNAKLKTQNKRLACINLSASNAILLIERVNVKIDAIKRELELEHEKRAAGARIRIRIRWHEYGEKSSKYFLRL